MFGTRLSVVSSAIACWTFSPLARTRKFAYIHSWIASGKVTTASSGAAGTGGGSDSVWAACRIADGGTPATGPDGYRGKGGGETHPAAASAAAPSQKHKRLGRVLTNFDRMATFLAPPGRLRPLARWRRVPCPRLC